MSMLSILSHLITVGSYGGRGLVTSVSSLEVQTAVWQYWLSKHGGNINSLDLMECVHLMCPRWGHSTENKQREREGDNKNVCSCKAPESAINGRHQAGQGVKRQYDLRLGFNYLINCPLLKKLFHVFRNIFKFHLFWEVIALTYI